MTDLLFWVIMYLLTSGVVACWVTMDLWRVSYLLREVNLTLSDGSHRPDPGLLLKFRRIIMMSVFWGAFVTWPYIGARKVIWRLTDAWEWICDPWPHIERLAAWRRCPRRLRRKAKAMMLAFRDDQMLVALLTRLGMALGRQ